MRCPPRAAALSRFQSKERVPPLRVRTIDRKHVLVRTTDHCTNAAVHISGDTTNASPCFPEHDELIAPAEENDVSSPRKKYQCCTYTFEQYQNTCGLCQYWKFVELTADVLKYFYKILVQSCQRIQVPSVCVRICTGWRTCKSTCCSSSVSYVLKI